MRNGIAVIDSDGHVHEDVGDHGFRRFMDAQYRNRPAGGGFVDRSVGGKYGKRHGNPVVQIEDMDTEGVDVAVLYPTTRRCSSRSVAGGTWRADGLRACRPVPPAPRKPGRS